MPRLQLRLAPLTLVILLLLVIGNSARDNSESSGSIASAEEKARQHDYLAQRQPATDKNIAKADVGTKDAPVDGLDGKPHAGPFVDASDALKKAESSRDTRMSDEAKSRRRENLGAEEGVMNDPSRRPPKKGTTGTEGGVSEKDRDRKIHEFSTGERMAKVPDQPKSSLSTDDNPADAIDATKSKATEEGNALDGATDKLKGIAGIEKPRDLPARPYLDSSGSSQEDLKSSVHTSETNKHVPTPKLHGKHNDDDDDDDDEDDDDEEDGKHDIIPWDSLVGSFSSIAATEIGDKTFIVAALMAMRHSRLQVFSAAFSALFIMTILSGVAGHLMGAIISKKWSALVAALLFLVFGAKSIREGMEMSPNQGVSDEIREVEAELEEKEGDMAKHANGHRRVSSISPYALEAGRQASRKSRSRSRLAAPRRSPSSSRSPSPSKPAIASAISGVKNLLGLLLSPAWVETFSMTFVGELGDRSQIATVAMAAGQEYYWVMVGASAGHFICTGIAVLGGSVLAGRVSLRKVTLIGGAIFIGFGIFTLIEAVQYW